VKKLAQLLNRIADDYGQKGSGKKLLPSQAEINKILAIIESKKSRGGKQIPLNVEMKCLEKAIKRVESIVHMKTVSEIGCKSGS